MDKVIELELELELDLELDFSLCNFRVVYCTILLDKLYITT
jgi:hypothetical protein